MIKLGNKICIIGCSSSGKSTLGKLLSDKLNITCYHLDRLAHQENTNWQRTSDDDFNFQHNQLMQLDKWIIDGNYSKWFSERLKNATSIIWLDLPTIGCLIRYLKRSLKRDPTRVGNLNGASKEWRFFMVKHIMITYRKNRQKYKKTLEEYQTKLLIIKSMTELKKFITSINLVNSD